MKENFNTGSVKDKISKLENGIKLDLRKIHYVVFSPTLLQTEESIIADWP